MIKNLLRCLIALVIVGLIYWLGCLAITAFHAPIVFVTIWMVICIIVALCVLWKILGGPSDLLP